MDRKASEKREERSSTVQVIKKERKEGQEEKLKQNESIK